MVIVGPCQQCYCSMSNYSTAKEYVVYYIAGDWSVRIVREHDVCVCWHHLRLTAKLAILLQAQLQRVG